MKRWSLVAHRYSRFALGPSLLLVVGLAPAGCERATPNHRSETGGTRSRRQSERSVAWFEEVAHESGLVFVHHSGHHERHLFPEIMCGGGALFDMDQDGDLDAYLVQSGSLVTPREQHPGNQLYRNRGDGTFEDVTAGSGADDRGYGMGVGAGDYDNDGDVDLYITNVGPNVLLRNDGDGRFTDVTAVAGVGHPGWGSSVAFVDYDADGDLDLFVVNYIHWSAANELDCYKHTGLADYCSPKNYNAPAPDVLYRNEGDGTFTDVSNEAGLATAFGNGLGVVCGDFNADGRTDCFVANDGMENQLWLNQGGGRFEDAATLSGCAVDRDGKAKAGMGVDAADIDDDGDLDLLVVNLDGESDSFYINAGEYFSDATAVVGLGTVSRGFTRFSVGLVDFDNDGFLDLYQANGRVTEPPQPRGTDPFAEPNMVLRGGPEDRFAAIQPDGGTAEPLVATSRAAAFGDVDGDGGVDVLVVNRDAPAYLLKNVVPQRGHWISVRVLDGHGRDALGATVRFSIARRRIRRDVRSAYGYCASNDPRVHVGLGQAGGVTDVTVTWPDGQNEGFGAFDADQVVTLRRGAGGKRGHSRAASDVDSRIAGTERSPSGRR